MTTHSRALHMAHLIYKDTLANKTSLIAYDPQLEWRNALKRAWYFIHLREAFCNGVVRFSYWKKDGSIREANGTLSLRLIPTDKLPKGILKANDLRSGEGANGEGIKVPTTKDRAMPELPTTNDQLPTTNDQRQGYARTTNYSVFNYFDLEKGDWRSFDIRSFIGFVTIYGLIEMTGSHCQNLRPSPLAPSPLSPPH